MREGSEKRRQGFEDQQPLRGTQKPSPAKFKTYRDRAGSYRRAQRKGKEEKEVNRQVLGF